MQMLLVYASDDEGHDWVDSCWQEEKREGAIERAMEFRERGFRSTVIAFAANHGNESMADEWDDDFQEQILPWDNDED